MKINIQKICGKKTVTRDDGEKIHDIIVKEWDHSPTFIINFDNILVASVSFIDEAFGKLALEHNKDALRQKLKFEKMVDYDRALLNDIMFSRFRQKELGQNGNSFNGKM